MIMDLNIHIKTYEKTLRNITVIMTLSRQDSLDGGSASRKTTAYTKDNMNTE
jgi:hypothetical protein